MLFKSLSWTRSLSSFCILWIQLPVSSYTTGGPMSTEPQSITLNLTSTAIAPHLFWHKHIDMCTHTIHITHTTFAYVPFFFSQKLLEVDKFHPSTLGLLVFSPPHWEEEERSHGPWAGLEGRGGGQYSKFEELHGDKSNATEVYSTILNDVN